MTYTDTQLKQCLAKMLPAKLQYYTNPSTNQSTLFWKNSDPRFVESVKDTELLALCRMVEETFTNNECDKYSRKLSRFVGPPSNYSATGWFFHASYQQRITALAAVKGIEFV